MGFYWLVTACMLCNCQVVAARSPCSAICPQHLPPRARSVSSSSATPPRSHQRSSSQLQLANRTLSVSSQHAVPCRHQPAAGEAQDIWTSHIGTAAVLIVDATNRASVSAADARVYKHAGATLHGTFEAWLVFLRTLLQPELCIAVFDPPQVKQTHAAADGQSHQLFGCIAICKRHTSAPKQGKHGSRRQQAVPEYGRQRHAKAQRQRLAVQTSRPNQPQHRQQRSRRQHLQHIAEAAGYTVVEAMAGWEADDVIGALCAATDAADNARR